MSKKNFIEEFKSYLSETSDEQFLKDWAETEKYAEVGPTVEEYFNNEYFSIKVREGPDERCIPNIINHKIGQGFSSGLCF